MKDIIIKSVFHVYKMNELDEREQQLITLAIEATDKSYAPYSNFNVGAAVLLGNGVEIIGSNQENAAYPSGLCAERTAVFSANAQYPDQPIVALAIAARNGNGLLKEPVTPCGSCRQVILETEHRYKHPVKILLYGTNDIYVADSINDLLPLQFVSESMTAE
jgi:cytidine deaminase